MKIRTARILLASMIAAAALEWVASALAYRTVIEQEDWNRLQKVIETDDVPRPILLATPWMRPSAQQHLPSLRSWSSLARPDLRGMQEFTVLGLSTDDWSPELEADLQGLPHPTMDGLREVGPFTLYHYTQPFAGKLVWDSTSAATSEHLHVQAGGARCRGREDRWHCDQARVQLRTAEVDHRPRRCYAVQAADGTRVRLRFTDVVLGNMLRGHVGFDDFNARLRSDAPVLVSLRIGDQPPTSFVVTDEQGWWPFAVATVPGRRTVEVELLITASGTWDRGKYRPRKQHVPCIELRGMEELRG